MYRSQYTINRGLDVHRIIEDPLLSDISDFQLDDNHVLEKRINKKDQKE